MTSTPLCSRTEIYSIFARTRPLTGRPARSLSHPAWSTPLEEVRRMTIVVVALVALVLLHGRSAGAGAGAGGTAATLPDPHAPIPGTGGAPAALSALGTLEKIDVA